jgi:hypothetical protein
MEPVLTQVESVTRKKYHAGFQSTLGMAIPSGDLPKWVINNMDIDDENIKTAYTKLTEAISVNTAGKKNFLCFFAYKMYTIGKLEKVLSEKKINKTNKKPDHKNKTRRPTKSGGNAHVSTEAGCDADRDEEDAGEKYGWHRGMGKVWMAMAI